MYKTIRISGLTETQAQRVRRAAERWAGAPSVPATTGAFVKAGRNEYAPLHPQGTVYDVARLISVVAGKPVDYEVIEHQGA